MVFKNLKTLQQTFSSNLYYLPLFKITHLQLKALDADVGLWTSHAADYTSPVKWPISAIFWHKNPIQPFSIFFSLKHTVLSWRAMGAMELNQGFSWSSLDLRPICPRCALFVSQCTNVLEQAVTVHWPSSPIKSHLLSSGWKGYVDRGGNQMNV